MVTKYRIWAEKILVVCLQDGEKSLLELFKSSRLQFNTVQKYMLDLVSDGFVERRWDVKGRYPKYMYKLTTRPVLIN